MSSASRWRGTALAALFVLGGLLLPSLSWAGEVSLEVTVVHKGGTGGDAACAEQAKRLLGKDFAGESLRCLEVKKRSVGLNEVWKIALPTGNHFVVRTMDVSADQGVLVAVDLESSLQGDFRVRRNKPLVLGGPSYKGGTLVIILKPDY